MPARFLDEHGQPVELAANMFGVEQADPRGQDGRFDDGVLGAIEAEEIAQRAAVDDAGDNRRALVAVVERLDAKRVPAAGVGQDHAFNRFGRHAVAAVCSSRPTAARASSSTSSVTCSTPCAGALEILIGDRRAKRPQQQPLEVGVDDRPHRRDVRRAVGVERRDDAFEQRAVGQARDRRVRIVSDIADDCSKT